MGPKISSSGSLSALLILLFFASSSSLQRDGKVIHRPHHHVADSDSPNKEKYDDIAANRHDTSRQKRQVNRHATLWKNNTMFYYFDDNLNRNGRDAVEQAMRYLSARTCINFYEDSSAENRVRFYGGYRCASQWQDGEQTISVCPDVFYGWYKVGDMIHEIMHSLGISHMHSRNDRDDYVRVNLSSLQKGAWKSDFKKKSADEIINYTPYDYGSVMHYSAGSYREPDGTDTIITVDARYNKTIGSPIASFYDIMMINKLYGCSNQCKSSNGIKCANGGIQNPRNCDVCICPYGYGGRFCDERPPGCGATLEASPHWKTEQFTFEDVIVKSEDQGYVFCNHWIQAPLGKQIEVRVTDLPGCCFCKYGCTDYAIEPKVLSDKRITNPRFCCFDQLQFNKTLTSELNPTPIFSYRSNTSFLLLRKTAEFKFQYRYI